MTSPSCSDSTTYWRDSVRPAIRAQEAPHRGQQRRPRQSARASLSRVRRPPKLGVMAIDLSHRDAALDRVVLNGWDPDTVSTVITEITDLLSRPEVAAQLSGLAARFVRQIVVEPPPLDALLEHLRYARPPGDQQSHWEQLVQLLEDKIEIDALCAELRRRYIDPTAALVELLTTMDQDRAHCEKDECDERHRRATQALLFFAEDAGLRFLVQHVDFLITNQLATLTPLLRTVADRLDGIVTDMFDALPVADSTSWIFIFVEHQLACPRILDKALSWIGAQGSLPTRSDMWEAILLTNDPRGWIGLRDDLDATLDLLRSDDNLPRSDDNDLRRWYASWGLHILREAAPHLVSVQIEKAHTLGLLPVEN